MKVVLSDGATLECLDKSFASGTDGECFWSRDGKFLVKLYFRAENWREASLDAILGRFNAVKGEPYWEDVLCWPTAIVKQPRLGVVVPKAAMGLKKIDNFGVVEWLNYHKEDVGTWHGRLGMTIQLARAVKRLHFKGLAHSDLSGNNVFGNPAEGRSYVIDCDGLVVPNLEIARPVVVGTQRWMAPELESGQVTEPSAATDLHALAVIIYELLLLRHPLAGRKVHDPNDPKNDDRIKYGSGALFVEHPTDSSNRPDRLPWPHTILGTSVSSLMYKALVTGLFKPAERPLAASWERELVRLFDTMVFCLNPNCFFKSFPLPADGRGKRIKCPWCGTALAGFDLPVLYWLNPVPGQIGVYRADGTFRAGWPDATIHEWHIRPNSLPGPNSDQRALAAFCRTQSPSGEYNWFLVNQQMPYMEVCDSGQVWKRVRTSQAVKLQPGRKIRFGPMGMARDAVVDMWTLV